MNERKSWTKEEDFLICKIINDYPQIKWPKILSQIKKVQPCFSRTSKQIRQRWKYHLDPNLKKQPWTQQELDIIFKAHTLNGSKWKQIQKLLPGRSEKSIKNLYYMTLRKSLRRVTKILGAKNSTNQSRQIKAHIITKIIESTNEKPEKRQIIYRLVQLSKIRNGKCKKSLIDKQDIEIYRQLMDQILYFNELYFVDKKNCIEALDLKIENLKTLNLGADRGCQNSIIIKASTVPQLQSRDESLLSICQDDSFLEQKVESRSQENQGNQQQFERESCLLKESQNTFLK